MILGVRRPWRHHRKPSASVRFQAGEPWAGNPHLPRPLRLHQADRQQPAPAEEVLLLHLHASGLHAPHGGGVGAGQPQLLPLRIFPATGRDCPEVPSPTFKASSSVTDQWHFGVDPDPRIHAPFKRTTKNYFLCLLLFEGTFTSFFNDKKSKRSNETVGIKVFLTIFAW